MIPRSRQVWDSQSTSSTKVGPPELHKGIDRNLPRQPCKSPVSTDRGSKEEPWPYKIFENPLFNWKFCIFNFLHSLPPKFLENQAFVMKMLYHFYMWPPAHNIWIEWMNVVHTWEDNQIKHIQASWLEELNERGDIVMAHGNHLCFFGTRNHSIFPPTSNLPKWPSNLSSSFIHQSRLDHINRQHSLLPYSNDRSKLSFFF